MVKKIIIATLLVTIIPLSSRAQAYDGDADSKLFVGYLNFSGKSGAEIGYERGISDFLSCGIMLRYVEGEKDSDGDCNFLYGVNGAAVLNCHFQDCLKLPHTADIVAGPRVSLRSDVGIAVGIRYNFGEVVGVYAQTERNLLRIVKPNNDFPSPYTKKWGFSVGLTFNL